MHKSKWVKKLGIVCVCVCVCVGGGGGGGQTQDCQKQSIDKVSGNSLLVM